MSDAIGMVMGHAINLNCQPGFSAVEVQNVGADGMLTPKLQATEAPGA